MKGKTILVTGGRRVGQIVADELARAGANIAMTYLTGRDEVTQAVGRLRDTHGIKARAYEVDLTDEASIHALVVGVTKDFGSIDAVVNMASIYKPDPAAIGLADIINTFSVNAFGGMILARHFAEAARERGAKLAPIVSFIDWAVDHPYARYDLYLAAKAALRHYLMSLQTTFAGTVRIVNIHPALILEPPEFPADEKQVIISHTPTQDVGTPEQAAKLVHLALTTDFLADNIYLDGGQHWRHRL